MKILNISAVIFIFLVSGLVLSAATIKVPSDQPDIQAGIDASVNGDTVLVAPGTYRVNLDFKGKSITLTSEAGPLLTTLKPYTTDLPIVNFENSESPLAILEKFTLKERYNKPSVQIYNSSPIIRDNIFTESGDYFGGGIVYIKGNSSCTIQRNLFYNNPGAYVVLWEDSDAPSWILNNTINGGRQGLILWGLSTTAYGNSVTNCSGGGVSAESNANTAYNNVWGNTEDWSFGTAGDLDVTLNPEFVGPANGNFCLSESSPLIDFGNPDVNYNDPDGTRNDIGAIPFDQRKPQATNLHLENYEVTNVLDHYPTFYWSFYDLSPTQTAFELEVGSDKDWSVAEWWSTGEVTSPDTFMTYDGSALDNGTTNYYRIRVNNGSQWGNWSESVFRINSIPSAPTLDSPVDQEIVSMFGVRLSVENSIDAEGDDLTYSFEIYSDAGQATLVETIENITEQNAKTVTDKIADLDSDTEYWWRCRAYDSYEYSPWSDLNSFITRAPVVIRVPAEFETLQAGIDAAEERDTVLVANGTYSGEGNRDLSFDGTNVIFMSENGQDETVIDCAGDEPHQGFIFGNGEDTTSIVDGFTITNAESPNLWNEAAIKCQSSPIIKNCRIFGNTGDGILCSYGAAPIIRNCIISDNTGGGVRCGWSDLTMSDCLVYGNGENGLLVNYGAINISQCTFAYNTMSGLLLEGDPPKISFRADDSAVVYNCIMAFNGERGMTKLFYYYPELQVKCNNAYGNVENDWTVDSFGADDEFGNISADPLFCDHENEDFSIGNISPCAPDNNDCSVLMGAGEVGCTMTDVEEQTVISQVPDEFILEQNYPNPFNPSTIIRYSLPTQSDVKIIVYNILGRQIKTLVDDIQIAGEHSVYWNGTNENEERITSGIYLYKIITDDYISSRKMILLK